MTAPHVLIRVAEPASHHRALTFPLAELFRLLQLVCGAVTQAYIGLTRRFLVTSVSLQNEHPSQLKQLVL
jgi:hypothetical protein